jgi:hypothetical protein
MIKLNDDELMLSMIQDVVESITGKKLEGKELIDAFRELFRATVDESYYGEP